MLASELIQLCWAGNLLFLFIALGAGLLFKDLGCCEVLLAGAGAKPDVPVQWDSEAPSGKNFTGVSYTHNPRPPPQLHLPTTGLLLPQRSPALLHSPLPWAEAGSRFCLLGLRSQRCPELCKQEPAHGHFHCCKN